MQLSDIKNKAIQPLFWLEPSMVQDHPEIGPLKDLIFWVLRQLLLNHLNESIEATWQEWVFYPLSLKKERMPRH
jgi:hypothetical protein